MLKSPTSNQSKLFFIKYITYYKQYIHYNYNLILI
nr:MAG TPA: hypothetical protein [Caudoviricetes sp.]